MKNIVVLIVVVPIIIAACNQGSNGPAPVETVPADTIKTSSDTAKTELMKVSELSAQELKDDSVFSDGSISTTWEIAGITDVKGLKTFIKQLQQWVIANDKENLAAAIQYPLNKTIKTKGDLLANYDVVFTKDVRLSFATINFSQLFRNADGVMTDGGKVWLAQQGKEFKIIAINYEHDHDHAH
jgi:DeoR/GlpR family transcriptional regulator of sugar metabolism